MITMTHDRNGREIKPKVKRGSPERTAQVAVKRWLEAVVPGVMVAAAVNEAKGESEDPYARARYGMARKAAGVKTGFPDLTVLIPGGQVLFIEMKSLKGTTSDEQDTVHLRMREMGFAVAVVRSIDDARAFILAQGIETREAS